MMVPLSCFNLIFYPAMYAIAFIIVAYSDKRKSTCYDISAETATPETTMTPPTAPTTTTLRVAPLPTKTAAWVMQQFHAIIGPMVGAIAAFQIDQHISSSNDLDYINHKNVLLTMACYWEIGYYAFDLVVSIAKCIIECKYDIFDLGFNIHHGIPVISAATFLAWRESRVTAATDLVTACIMVSNLQSAFYNFLHIPTKNPLPSTHPAYYRAALVLFILSCVILRFYGLFWLLRYFASMHGLPTTVQHGWRLMPLHCKCSTVVIMSLNAIWLTTVVRKKAIPAFSSVATGEKSI